MTPLLAPGATAFLDRDGTINVGAPAGEYVLSSDRLELLPGAAAAIRRLNELPAKAIVVTNQRGIALGLMSEADLTAVNARLEELLTAEGARVDAILHCPHGKDECDCRKPGPGMFRRAVQEVPGVSLEGAAMIGDSALDIEAGNRLDLTTVRIGPDRRVGPVADHQATDLAGAVALLLRED